MFGICKHTRTAGPPADTVVEILSPVSHFQSLVIDRHLLSIAEYMKIIDTIQFRHVQLQSLIFF